MTRRIAISAFVLISLASAPFAASANDRTTDVVVADFEGNTYPPGWTTTGAAFGSGPAHSTLPNQQHVDGYSGHGFVNTYLAGDPSIGTLTSPLFTLQRDYLNFLIGGGNHPAQTCVNLLIDDQIIRTATGSNDEHLDPRSWDLRLLRGKIARIQILDNATGDWGHINLDQIVQSDTPANPDDITPPALYSEHLRPQFHFSPAKGWMNDPNGLVFFSGEYHLFFQHNPNSLQQTPVMSWGHAVSPDLLHWTQLPIALSPDPHDGWIWSGSAVVDWKNTSGFGIGAQPPLVAIYTAAKDPFAQALAYSNDHGRTWTKFPANPVLAHIANQNRDPHVIWHAPTSHWIMALYKDVGNTFCLFSSTDLKNWTHLQDLQMPGCTECPDFFPLPLDGDTSNLKWIFTAANGKYLVGNFDGSTFKPEQEVRQVDFGRNFYAVQTYSDIPAADGRRIQIAWMAGGKYPHMPFNQQMSFPAELSLHTTPDGPRLFRNPIRELNQLHTSQHHWSNLELKPGDNPLASLTGDLFDIHADIDLGQAAEITFIICGQEITYNAKAKTLTALGTAPLPITDGHLKLQILVDRTSIETFANDGRISLTSCFLPGANQKEFSLTTQGAPAHIQSLVIHELKSIWP
jgi:sucrose-6-phosphate hydrolase SacC (GH32 family)